MVVGIGEALSVGCALAWAVGVILYRRLGEHLPPLALTFVKNSLVWVMLVISVLVVHGPAWPALTATQWFLTALSGVLGMALADVLYLRALNAIGAGAMGIIGNLYSPFVIALSFVFLGERFGPQQALGFGLVMAGVVLVGYRSPLKEQVPGQAKGMLLGAASIAVMAVAIVIVKRVLEESPLFWITLIRMSAALVVLGAVLAWRGELRSVVTGMSMLPWRLLLPAAFVGQYLSTLMWLGGYKFAPASVAAVLNESASAFIVLLAWLWLKEPVSRRAITGIALTLTGVTVMLI
ncbi:MAG TPA: DMT family transporter [Aquimonas sp.]|nr:DMT family transporter [Aquimonas sp.]